MSRRFRGIQRLRALRRRGYGRFKARRLRQIRARSRRRR